MQNGYLQETEDSQEECDNTEVLIRQNQFQMDRLRVLELEIKSSIERSISALSKHKATFQTINDIQEPVYVQTPADTFQSLVLAADAAQEQIFEQIRVHIGTISISYGPGVEDAFCLQLEEFSLDNLGQLACVSLLNFLSKEAKCMTLKLPLLVYV